MPLVTWERQLTNVALKPSCHEQGCREMESSAERREEAFELMRYSRYLHKSAMNRLPEQQDQTPAVREGLAKIDGNMVRYAQQTKLASKQLHLCTASHCSRPSS